MLGPHGLDATAQAYYWASRARIVKQVDGTDLLKAAPAGAITIFRHWYPNSSQDIGRNGGDVAREVISRLGGFRPTYIELYNEVGAAQHIGSGLQRYAAFHSQAVPVAHDNGIKVMGYSFSTGAPESYDWDYLRSVQYGGVDAIGLHEYWTRQYGFTGWNALRYRKVHQWTNGQHPPFCITECGEDVVNDQPGGGQVGQAGYIANGTSVQQFAAELIAYDAEISRDPYVIGATPFTNGPGANWQPFNMDPVVPVLFGVSPDCDPNCCRERTDCLSCPNALTCYPPVVPGGVPPWLLGLGVGALAGGLALAITTPRYAIGKKKIIYLDKRTMAK